MGKEIIKKRKIFLLLSFNFLRNLKTVMIGEIEPGGKYLWHFTPEKNDVKKPAEIMADNIVNHLRERNIDQTMKVIGGDSTNMNTGWQGGVMQWIEQKIRGSWSGMLVTFTPMSCHSDI